MILLPRRADPGADVPQLGPGGDERLEPERGERTAVVGDDGDERLDRAVGVARSNLLQRPAAQQFGLIDGEFGGGDGVMLVCGGRDVSAY
ncbi:hypothetical protein ABZ883_13245 [Streptomyces sp. NPDC046977]|uniref:hypothetical protein n=1 Tax=Streptomyces sp. NPDC046977 TaxID=3154703 RepID=UPI0033CC84D7